MKLKLFSKLRSISRSQVLINRPMRVLGCLLIWGLAIHPALAEDMTNAPPQTRKQLLKVAEAFLNVKWSTYVHGKPKTVPQDINWITDRFKPEFQKDLDFSLNSWSRDGSDPTYCGFTVKFSPNARASISKSKTRATLIVEVDDTEYFCKSKEHEANEESGTISVHIFQFAFEKGVWKLDSHEQDEPWKHAQPNEARTGRSIVPPDLPTFDPEGPLEPKENILNPAIDVLKKESRAVMPGTSKMLLVARKYDRAAAVAYAKKYAKSSNPIYLYIKGKDCTNFVSQALYAGGWSDEMACSSGWCSWWYAALIHPSMGTAWVNANDFFSYIYLLGHLPSPYKNSYARAQLVTSTTQLQLGDIVQFDWGPKPDGRMDHTMMVTSIDSKYIYLSGHSEDHKDIRLVDMLTSSPHAKWYGWHLYDKYNIDFGAEYINVPPICYS